jgi:hypothetical protein
MQTYDLQIAQGTSYQLSVTLTDFCGAPIDLSLWNLSGYIKYNYGSTGYLTNLNPTAMTPTSGIITLSMGSAETSTLPIGINFYDIKLVTGDISILALAGKAFVSPTVS